MPLDTDRFTLSSGIDVAVEVLENGEAVMLWKVDRSRPAPPPATLRLLALGRRRASLQQIGGSVELSPRHSEILTLLVLHPEGLTGARARRRDLRVRREGRDDPRRDVAAAEPLGCLLVASPYRLVADVDADFLEVERLLHSGDRRAAARRYIGPLLVGSKVPGIVEARERLERDLRPAALAAPLRRRSAVSSGAADGRLRLDESRRALAGLAPGAGPGRHAGRARAAPAPPRA